MIHLDLDFPRIVGPGPITYRATDPILQGVVSETTAELAEGQRAEDLAVQVATDLCGIINSYFGDTNYQPRPHYETPENAVTLGKSEDFGRWFRATLERQKKAPLVVAAWRAHNVEQAKNGEFTFEELETFSQSVTVLDAMSSLANGDVKATEEKIMNFRHKISEPISRRLEWVNIMKEIMG